MRRGCGCRYPFFPCEFAPVSIKRKHRRVTPSDSLPCALRVDAAPLPIPKRLEIGQILVPTRGQLVPAELTQPDERNRNAPELTRGPTSPRFLPRDSGDPGEEIDPDRRPTVMALTPATLKHSSSSQKSRGGSIHLTSENFDGGEQRGRSAAARRRHRRGPPTDRPGAGCGLGVEALEPVTRWRY